MPIILAIETSSELASAALLHGDDVLIREAAGVQTHSQTVLPMVQSLLAQTGLKLAQCEAIAFGAGPGSFTGVRTACGLAQGLAFGLDLPVLPIVTLLAMAQACRETSGTCDVLSVLDARMGEVYWAQYHFDGGWQTVVEPTLSAPAGVLPQGNVVACGNGLSAYASEFEAQAFFKDAWLDCVPHAAQIARLAQGGMMRGEAIAAREAQPVYLRNKVALTTSERLAKATA